jgi:hypothetical protein
MSYKTLSRKAKAAVFGSMHAALAAQHTINHIPAPGCWADRQAAMCDVDRVAQMCAWLPLVAAILLYIIFRDDVAMLLTR